MTSGASTFAENMMIDALDYVAGTSLCDRTADTAETVDHHRPLHMQDLEYAARRAASEALAFFFLTVWIS